MNTKQADPQRKIMMITIMMAMVFKITPMKITTIMRGMITMNTTTMITTRPLRASSMVACALAVALAGCEGAQEPMSSPEDAAPIFYSDPAFKEKGYPFSEAVEAGGFVFLSGQLGTDPETTQLVEGGIEPQARQTMENIKAALESRDLTFAHVVKCTVMIDDMADWPAFNTVYATYFDGEFPARSAFGADGLALGAAVEVECIAKR